MNIILASGSPRRREILSSLGVTFRAVTADADESSSETDPGKLTEKLALRKGEAVLERLRTEGLLTEDTLIIASDTVVSVNGQILGKPHGRADAERMLRMLSGTEHEVVSSIALIGGGRRAVSHDTTTVCFDPVPESLLHSYLASDEPYDKAGAYAIQGMASLWIRGIRGDYFGVVGLPVNLLARMTRDFTGKELTEL